MTEAAVANIDISFRVDSLRGFAGNRKEGFFYSTMKNSMLFYSDWLDSLSGLPDDKRLLLMECILRYGIYGDIPESLEPMEAALMKLFTSRIDSDNDKYNAVVERNRTNGSKGGRPKTQKNPEKPRKPSGFSGNPKNPVAPLDNDNDNDNDNGGNLLYPPSKEEINEGSYEEVNTSEDSREPDTKPRKRKEKSSAKKEKIDLLEMGVTPEMIPVVEEWMQYKTERHESYKPRGFMMFYKRLCELSGGSAVRARKIIEQSMGNNYSGIFALKPTSNGKEARSEQEEMESLMRAVAEGIAIANTPQKWEL